ncbi:hypothetical protein L207DRAFT_629204 [Hyaloscypha variabilis F]|uniref:2EXR domain-containing protein n=1 Tax=Hyaloscypha variabilis (strain UAMH 11265 / GT02V1 / F) TaxID=1149755 RepID=A0A2J6S7E2_HYAVF|nr:hypothetical protein L207DRAFT_629204 [Hyaloscypha variabilis F]
MDSTTKQELGDRIESTCSDASPTQSVSPSPSSTNVAPNCRVENVDSDISFLTSTPNSQTTPHSATERPSDLEVVQVSTSVPDHQQTIGTASEMSFTLFPKFPLELRRMVWSCAISSPRVIELQSVKLTPRVTKSIALMAVCREAREVALAFYHLIRLGPTISTPPFYFSAENSICLLNDSSSTMMLLPPAIRDTSHPWNTFRKQVTTLAVDPLLYYGQANSPDHPIVVAAGQGLKIGTATAIFAGLKELIILRRAGFQEYSRATVAFLTTYGNSGGYRRMLPSSVDWRVPHITYLDYGYNDGENPWEAVRKALLAHRQ